MSHPGNPESSGPCVWMSAGFLAYKLCDRDLDCERCPLDAALRGEAPADVEHQDLPVLSRRPRAFPTNRSYSSGHLWVQGQDQAGPLVLRLGIDTFAAAVIGRCRDVRWRVSDHTLQPGEIVFEIDLGLGLLPLGAPLAGHVVNGNRALKEDPNTIVTAPYGNGWVVDLVAERRDDLELLLKAEEQSEQSRLDLRRFRRRVAHHLLAETSEVGPTEADGGELLTDLRQILGGPRYLGILRELIH